MNGPVTAATRDKTHASLLLAAILAGFIIFPAPSWAQEAMPGPTSEYTSAAECGRCHQELYQSWRKTFHAQAAANPLFLSDLERIDASYGRGMRVMCVSCHSPTTTVTMDYSLAKPISQEGVTCDFCHTVTSVDLAGRGMKVKNDLSPVKAGPGREGSLAAHRTRATPLLLESEFCAGCHQWVNEQGVAVLDTYREWYDSPYRGEQAACQMCHMPEIMKTTILLQGRIVERPSHLHMEMGGHSQTQLATAARLHLRAAVKEGQLTARATVENFKGGHMLPTGIPSRIIILEVSLLDSDGKLLEKQEKAYQRILADAEGRPLEDMITWELKAAKVLEDSRLKPKEKRVEMFTFRLPEKAGAMIVKASLKYRLKVANLNPPFFDYEMASDQKIVGGGPGKREITRGMAVALAVLILVIIALLFIKLGPRRNREY